jgi:hypothetical protein
MKASEAKAKFSQLIELLGDRAGYVELAANLAAGAVPEVTTDDSGAWVKAPTLRQAALEAAIAEKVKIEAQLRDLGVTDFDADIDDEEAA